MEPRIQYAKTSDGVSIAYSTLGEGEPLMSMPTFPWNHIQLEWQIPTLRRVHERLAQGRRLVRYDARGTGSSERRVTDFSLEAHILDLEAVVNRMQLDRCALVGRTNSARGRRLRRPQSRAGISPSSLHATHGWYGDVPGLAAGSRFPGSERE